jgi:multidrug efflux system membrane fusion protein
MGHVECAALAPGIMRLKSSYLIATGIAVALAGWLLSGQWGISGRPVAEVVPTAVPTGRKQLSVRVREVVAAPVDREIVLNGRTEPARTVELRAEVGGRVIELGAKRGAQVRAGYLLVKLDPRERAARVEEADATLAMRQIEYDAARKLGAKGFQAETKVAEAKAELEAAVAALEHAQIELSHTTILAPFDGVVDRPVELGDFVNVGDPVASVIELDPLLITGEVAETKVGSLAVGMPGSGRLITGQAVQGRVSYVGRQADLETRTFEIELEVDNPDSRVAAGVSAELHILEERIDAHRLSPALLSLDDDGQVGVKALADDDTVVFYPARIVRAEAAAVWLADLPQRLRLITVGQGFVRPGDRVRAVPEATIVAPGPPVEPQA